MPSMFLGHEFEAEDVVLQWALHENDIIIGRIILAAAAGSKGLLLLHIFL